MLGPMGSGARVAKPELRDAMPPYHGGGEMISRVFDDHSTYNKIPHKFEAGTPNVEAAVGLAAAIDYLEKIGLERIAEHEQALAQAAIEQLTQIDGVTVYGPRGHRAGVVSFTYGDIHPHDIATILDQPGLGVDDDAAAQRPHGSPGALARGADERDDAGRRVRGQGQVPRRPAGARRRVQVPGAHQVRALALERTHGCCEVIVGGLSPSLFPLPRQITAA